MNTNLVKSFFYVISSDFDYSKRMYNGDSGKEYADSLDIETITWKECQRNQDCDILFFDSRLSQNELLQISLYINDNKNKIFLMAITDPYFEQEKDSPYIKFLYLLKNNSNVGIVSKYQPEEITQELYILYGKNRFLTLNYVYDPKEELTINYKNKKNKILLSGSLNFKLYPERNLLHKFSRVFPLNMFVDILQHPGYPDVGQKLNHDIIGENYINFISSYRFMFVTPSRCKLEFLKYRESGYAGTIILGLTPKTFPANLSKSMIEINPFFPFLGILKALLMSQKKYLSKINSFREVFLKERKKTSQILLLNKFICKFN